MKKTSSILAMLVLFAFSGNVWANQTIESSIEANAQLNNIEASRNYSNMASIKFLKRDTKGAILDFDKAIELNPTNPELYLNRGYIKQLTNDLEGAMNDYNSALKINPKFAFAYNNRGVLKVALKDIEGAMNDYAKAIEINGRYSDAYYNRANLKYMLNDNKGALADYDRTIELNPKDSEAYNNRGVVKKRLNFNVGALSDYTQAIALNPKDSIAYANRGRLKKLYFDNEGAAIDLDQAVALAETQQFIKNVKPLLSKENYIVAVPNSSVVEANAPLYSVPTRKEDAMLASNTTKEQVKPISYESVEKSEPVVSNAGQVKKEEIKPKIALTPSTSSTPKISAGVATVKAASAPVITTTAVTKTPTTNIKLAESYYIRGLQKCVLRDLQGAIADLNKAIENNSKYADAYYYRAAIRKELGDAEGFKKDYSTAIQINPSLQAFNDLNCITLVNG